MYISSVKLKNWMRYRGEFTFNLEPKAYAIVANWSQNKERSNAAGKSSFMEAIRFALFGSHRFPKEDNFISIGEEEATVEIGLKSGNRECLITRSRIRGSSTKLVVKTPEGKLLKGDIAQENIDILVGLSLDDFHSSSYFEQKELDRLITCRPGVRTEYITSWFNLDKIQKAIDESKDELDSLRTQILRYSEELNKYNNKKFPEDRDLEEVEKEIEITRDAAAKLLETYKEHIERKTTRLEKQKLDKERQKLIVEEIEILDSTELLNDVEEKSLEEELANLKENYREAEQVKREAFASLQEKKSLCKDGFSGTCPITHDQCPIRNEVSDKVEGNLTMISSFSKQFMLKEQEAVRLDVQCEKLDRKLSASKRLKHRLCVIREMSNKLGPVSQIPEEGEEPTEMLEGKMEFLKNEHIKLNSRKGEIERELVLKSIVEKSKSEYQGLKNQFEVVRSSWQVLKQTKNIISESNLQEIEELTNGFLTKSGLPLSLNMLWDREGDGLASHCTECGAPFSTSKKERVCKECGGNRGPKIVEKLELELSNKSGGMEDVCGVALGMAVGTWLKTDRGSSWSVLIVDEPFASLDSSNRKLLARYMAGRFMGDSGIEQMFVTAHQPEVLSMMPGKIVIEADEKGSRIKVDA